MKRQKVFFSAAFLLITGIIYARDPPEDMACTGGVAVQNATFDGRPVLWLNMDFSNGYSQLWKYKDPSVEVLYYGLGPKGMSHSLNSYGLARAVNEQRTLDYNRDKEWYPLRIKIDRESKSIADIRCILETKRYEGGKSFNFIDATGEGVYFEVADNDYWEYNPLNPKRLCNNKDYDYYHPNNFVVRANMPFKNRNHQELEAVIDGWNHESTPRIRFARKLMAEKINDAERLTPRELFEISRYGEPGINDEIGVICESRTKDATIYLGIKGGENPVFTTALFAMGIPDYSIFIPVWCKLSAEDLSSYLKSESPTIFSQVQALFQKNKNDGNGLDPSDDQFIQDTFHAVEENIIEAVLNARDKWLNKGDTDHFYEDMQRLHGRSCDAAFRTIQAALNTVDFGAKTVNEPPSVTSLGTTVNGMAVDFECDATDPHGFQSIAWDFGDGATTTGTLTPSHTYPQPGTYLVSCFVEDDHEHSAANVRFEYINISNEEKQ